MSQQDLTNIINKHCRFRFRGGKEAFGVIWEANGRLVFTSNERHRKLSSDESVIDFSELLVIDSDDVMMAELIA